MSEWTPDHDPQAAVMAFLHEAEARTDAEISDWPHVIICSDPMDVTGRVWVRGPYPDEHQALMGIETWRDELGETEGGDPDWKFTTAAFMDRDGEMPDVT